jgi:hypothetical protein
MKGILIFLILLEIVLSLFLVFTIRPDKENTSVALQEWTKNPTPENKNVWMQEEGIRSRKQLLTRICIFAAMGATAFGMTKAVSKTRVMNN